jgi:cytochrome c biogenesis protein CcdA
VSAGWGSLLAELTAFAMVVALSPFSIIPALAVVMSSDRPKPTGLAFVAGWLAGKAAITVVFIGVPRLLDGLEGLNRTPPDWTVWPRIVAGALSIIAGVWFGRRPQKTVETPHWVGRLKKITPTAAAAVGVGLTVVNFKVLLACAAAGLAIGAAHVSTVGATAAVVYFTAIAGSTAAVPILAYVVWTHQVDRQLERFKAWLQRRQNAITGALLVLIGIALLYNGISAI